MREFSTRLTTEIPSTGNLSDDVVRNAAQAPQSAAFSVRDGDTWRTVTAAEFHEEVRDLARGLIAAGIAAGERVALISRTRYEWTLIDYALWFAGAVSVPIYETSSAEQIQWILADSGASAVFVETEDHRARVAQIEESVPDLRHVWWVSPDALSELSALGSEIGEEESEQRRVAAGPEDLATLIYTSGTTGPPKGCMLTHGNFMFELTVACDALEELFDEADSSTLLFLPLAHVFARIIQVGAVKTRTRMGHSADISHLAEDLIGFQPTFILAVPRVFEKIFNTASQRAEADGRGAVFRRAAEVAMTWSRGLEGQSRVGPLVRLQHRLFDRLVYSRLRESLGGQCRFAISGGAPLGERLGHFYRGIGVTVLEGYGLTETTAALTANLPDEQKVGTVGRPLPGTTMRVADDGELWARGGQVGLGYWRNPEATASSHTEDGWFRTGDVGEIDDEGFIRITGRKKEILVTAGGKNVAPAGLEDRVRDHPLVDQCMVVGDGQPYIAALVTLDPETLAPWAHKRDKSPRAEDLIEDADLRAEIEQAIDAANSSVSRAESIRRFAVLPQAWTEEGGELTPSLKLRRNVVLRECGDVVEALYSRPHAR